MSATHTEPEVLSPQGPRRNLSRMAPRKKFSSAWSFGRKFSLWLTDNDITLNAFAGRHGFTQSSLQRWVKVGTRLPADALQSIAEATRLPADYWLDETIPYPPPADYANLADRLDAALKKVPVSELTEILAILENADDRRRTLELRRIARRP